MEEVGLKKWLPVRELIDFRVFIHIGGGLGDVVHRYKDSIYMRILKSIKAYFPNLYVYLYLHGKNVDLTKQIFESDQSINEIIAIEQKPGEFDWTYIERFMLMDCKVDKKAMAQYATEFGPEIIFRRVVNRIYPLIKFPRIRAISMDDFFQQLHLSIDDFKWDLAEVKITEKDDETAQNRISFAQAQGYNIMGVHPFSQDRARACYPTARWRALIFKLLRRGYAVALFGAFKERKLFEDILKFPQVIDLTLDLGLRPKIAVLKCCVGCVAIDGAIMHLAWLHAIPTVSIIEKEVPWSMGFRTVHGYHWAAVAGEPFAYRKIVEKGAAENIEEDEIIEKVIKLKDTKGKRISAIWRDQCCH